MVAINNSIDCSTKDMFNQGQMVAGLDGFDYFKSQDPDKSTDREADCHIKVNYSFIYL